MQNFIPFFLLYLKYPYNDTSLKWICDSILLVSVVVLSVFKICFIHCLNVTKAIKNRWNSDQISPDYFAFRII